MSAQQIQAQRDRIVQERLARKAAVSPSSSSSSSSSSAPPPPVTTTTTTTVPPVALSPFEVRYDLGNRELAALQLKALRPVVPKAHGGTGARAALPVVKQEPLRDTDAEVAAMQQMYQAHAAATAAANTHSLTEEEIALEVADVLKKLNSSKKDISDKTKGYMTRFILQPTVQAYLRQPVNRMDRRMINVRLGLYNDEDEDEDA